MKLRSHFCEESGCIRQVFYPHLYCNKHEDVNSTPPQPTDSRQGETVEPYSTHVDNGQPLLQGEDEDLREKIKDELWDILQAYQQPGQDRSTCEPWVSNILSLITQSQVDARHDALEEVGAIGADYHDSPRGNRLYRRAVEGFVLEEREKWYAEIKRLKGEQ